MSKDLEAEKISAVKLDSAQYCEIGKVRSRNFEFEDWGDPIIYYSNRIIWRTEINAVQNEARATGINQNMSQEKQTKFLPTLKIIWK